MKHIKTYESWFTNVFKSADGLLDADVDFVNKTHDEGYTPLMGAARKGNWKRFKFLLPSSKDEINSVNIMYLDSGIEARTNTLMWAIFGEGDLWEKKKMFTALIDNGIDIYFKTEDGENFYDKLKRNKDPKTIKLKEWIEKTYPDIIEKVEMEKSTNKYNL